MKLSFPTEKLRTKWATTLLYPHTWMPHMASLLPVYNNLAKEKKTNLQEILKTVFKILLPPFEAE